MVRKRALFLTLLLLGLIFPGIAQGFPQNGFMRTAPRVVTVGVYSFPPLMENRNGVPEGLYIDLLGISAKKHGWVLRYVPGTWAECLNALETGEIDILPAIGETAERLKTLEFTDQAPVIDWAIVYSRKGSDLNTFSDLSGKTIGIMKGCVFSESFRSLLDQFGVSATLVEYGDYRSILNAIDDGKLDSGISTNIQASVLENGLEITRTKIQFAPIELRYAAKKFGAVDILFAFDSDLESMRSLNRNDYATAYENWMQRISKSVLPSWIFPAIFIPAGIALVFALFALALKKSVEKKTSELAAVNKTLEETVWRRTLELTEANIEMTRTNETLTATNAKLESALGEVERTREHLIVQAKMATLGRLVASIAHELNTPLAAISSTGRKTSETVFLNLPDFIKCVSSGDDSLAEFAARVLSRDDIPLEPDNNLLFEAKAASLYRILRERGVGHAAHHARRFAYFLDEMELTLIPAAISGETGESFLDSLWKVMRIGINARTVVEASGMAVRTIERLRSFSWKKPEFAESVPVLVNLNLTIDTALSLFRNKISDGVEIKKEILADPFVMADSDRLAQIWINLIGNALDAMNYSGTLGIQVREREGKAVIEISDSGSGISPDVAQEVFKPFFTTKELGKGTGLGLHIVRQIVEEIAGDITFSSRPGNTVFVIRLPVAAAGAGA